MDYLKQEKNYKLRNFYEVVFEEKAIGKIPDEYMHKAEVYVGYHELLRDNYNPKLYVTIQYLHRLSKAKSDEATRNIMNLVSKKLFGSNFHRGSCNKLQGYCIAEKNKKSDARPDNYHYHIAISELHQTPDFMNQFAIRFNEVIENYFRIEEKYKQNKSLVPQLYTNRDTTNIKPIRLKRGFTHQRAIEYSLKTLKEDIRNADNLVFFKDGKLDFKQYH